MKFPFVSLTKKKVDDNSREVFIRHISCRLDDDVLQRISNSSTALKEMIQINTIPELVTRILRTSEDFANALESIREYYEIQNNKFKLNSGPVYIRNIVSKSCNKKSVVDLAFNEVPVSELIGDNSRICFVFEEVLKNACSNKIKVNISSAVYDSNIVDIEFCVSDSSSLTQEDLDERFVPFSGKGIGIGIGLCLSKKIVEEMGGSLTMISHNGKTTTSFNIRLSFEQPLVFKNLTIVHDNL